MATSAQDLIRALKAASDPPQPGGLYKIQIAREAWDNESLYIPSKEETVAEWVLTRLLKDKDKAGDDNPILDTRYWTLLKDILLPDIVKARTGGSSVRLRSWIPSLVSRVPVIPIVSSFGTACTSHVASLSPALPLEASNCLSVLWPYAVGKSSPDLLLECFGASLPLAISPLANHPGIPELLALITSGYRFAFGNSTHKKKLYSSFVQKHLHQWIRCIHSHSTCPSSPLSQEIYNTGIETIFNVENLRNSQDQTIQGGLEEKLSELVRSQTESTLSSLPRFLGSFVGFSRRFKGSYLGHIPSQDAGPNKLDYSRRLSMKLFSTFEGLLEHVTEDVKVWGTRVALLTIVDNENLFDPSDNDSKRILQRCGELAVQLMSSSPQGNEAQALVLETLSILTHIDYDLITDPLHRILPRLSTMTAGGTVLAYLGHLFDFHSKTRTVHDLALAYLHSYEDLKFHTFGGDWKSVYDAVSSSALQDQGFCDRLSRSVHGFLTPGQVSDVASSVLRHVQTVWSDFQESASIAAANEGQGPRKKRKKEGSGSSVQGGPGHLAVTFAGCAKIASLILTSLPLHTLPDDARDAVQQLIQDFNDATVTEIVKKSVRHISKEGRLDTWAWQIVALSTLRLRYHLLSTSRAKLSPQADAKFVSRLVSVIRMDETIPELRVEIIRSLLYEASQERCESTTSIEESLRLLEKDTPSHGWTGRLHDLNCRPEQTSTAVFFLITTRWLPLFDASATSEQLQRLVKLMMKSGIPKAPQGSIEMASIFFRTLQSAHFWELRRLTTALVSQVAEGLSFLTDFDTQRALQQIAKGKRHQEAIDMMSMYAAYVVLLYTPSDAIPRTVRTELFQHALAADVKLGCAHDVRDLNPLEVAQTFGVIREFMRRTCKHLGSEQLSPLFVDYLTDRREDRLIHQAAFTSTTLGLLRQYFSSLTAIAAKGNVSQIVSIIRSFVTSPTLNAPEGQEPEDGSLRLQSAVCLIDILTSEREHSDFSEDAFQVFQEFYKTLLAYLLPRIVRLANQRIRSDFTEQAQHILEGWYHVLTLRRWIGVLDPPPTPVGRALVKKLMDSTGPTSMYTFVLCISLEELNSRTVDRSDHVGFIIATYVAFALKVGEKDKESLDICISKASKSLPVPDFANALDLVFEGLSRPGMKEDGLSVLVELSSILVHHAPEGTLKLTQAHFTQCLGLFVNRPSYRSKISLRTQVLRLITRHVNDRPAAIRTPDISHIWSLFGELLEGSDEHELHTQKCVYQEMVSILNAVVRLRRDLALPTLPHLGVLLRRLLISLKTIPPQLGGKQTRLVACTLPSWINPSEPLGGDESKGIARLLTTFTTKTITRIHGTSSELQKAESISRPFSKHAPTVLLAYIDSLNDPLCILPLETRRELQPGLFALCDMMGEQNRDAMMVALDNGGKVILKNLWREYEKQRYTGKG